MDPELNVITAGDGQMKIFSGGEIFRVESGQLSRAITVTICHHRKPINVLIIISDNRRTY